MKYFLRPTARADLAGIWLYTAEHWSVAQADEYIAAIMRRIESAAEMPELGSRAAGLPHTYRKIATGSHRAIYRISDGAMIVVRILHVRQDVPDEIEDF